MAASRRRGRADVSSPLRRHAQHAAAGGGGGERFVSYQVKYSTSGGRRGSSDQRFANTRLSATWRDGNARRVSCATFVALRMCNASQRTLSYMSPDRNAAPPAAEGQRATPVEKEGEAEKKRRESKRENAASMDHE